MNFSNKKTMKKLAGIISLLLIVMSLNAQKLSPLSPVLVVWNTNDQNISLKNAKYGVQVNDSLSLEIYFNKLLLENNSKYSDLNLEFRWYYYLSTRKSLMFIDQVSYKKSKRIKDQVIYRTTQYSLQPGWWEVVVVNLNDGGFLQFGNTYKFQVFIK